MRSPRRSASPFSYEAGRLTSKPNRNTWIRDSRC